METTRRAFIAAIPCLAGAWSHSGVRAAKSPPVVDTHLHCFAGKADPRFPYHANGPYQPPDAATPEHLLKCMADAGVDAAVVVHPEPYQDDHRYLEHCLKVGGAKLKGTSLVFADRPDFEPRLRTLAKAVPLVATRVHAYNPDRLPPFEKPELARLWKLAGELGLAVQLHFEPRYAPGFERYLRDFPTVRVLIDHLGRPFQGTPKEHAVVVNWAKYPNVVMKLSSLPEADKYPHRDPAKVIRELTEAFGADRLMYGGGYDAKATGASYTAARERLRGLLGHLTAADQAKIFGETAAKLLRFTKQ